MSRITRKMAVSEICIISGQPREQTLKALSRLLEAGLLEAPDAPVAPDMSFGASTLSGKTLVVAPAKSQQVDAAPAAPDEGPQEEGLLWHALLPVPFDQFSPDEELMAEATALSEGVKRELQYVYAQLDQADYYQLLGLSRDADRKAVRAAFFAGSKRFHPDLFFGKELGGYKPMVDAIFQQLNKAQQILSHKNKREGYDAQLGAPQAPAPPHGAPSQMMAAVAPAAAQASPPRADSVSSQERALGASGGLGEASSVELSVEERRKREAAFALLLRRGERHELAGELELAAGEYRKAFAIKHDAAVALRGANLLLRLGAEHREEAILLARAAAKENPRQIKALLLVGDAYEELERLDEALLYYKRALEIEPDSEVIRRRIEYVQNMMR